MGETPLRFRDTGETIYSFMDEIFVVCPICRHRSCIAPIAGEDFQGMRLLQPRRVVCLSCGYVKEWRGNSVGFDPSAVPVCDSYFGLPLWLQAPCCGQILWAYNVRHLTLIESYVRAELREQQRETPHDYWHNASLANRLPEWMIVAKHRDAVLKAVAKLKREKLLATK